MTASQAAPCTRTKEWRTEEPKREDILDTRIDHPRRGLGYRVESSR